MKTLFVTGRLAEPALRKVLSQLPADLQADAEVAVLPISVAALMTTRWVLRQLHVPEGIRRVVLPGFCQGEVMEIEDRWSVEVIRGPKDLRDLTHFLTGASRPTLEPDGPYDIEILAEINHADRLTIETLLALARAYRRDGADVIDLGCSPGNRWANVGVAVRSLRDEGFRVSIDSFDPDEVEDAIEAGAELVLSVNGSNRERAKDWGVEVVVIPDAPHSLNGMRSTSDYLTEAGVPHRLDPVLDPIGFGFAASLGRYLDTRREFPEAAMMMGVGNLTELTDVDSAGINVLLAGFCQETGIRSVLTTQVINWARSSVRELDLARRLMHHAVANGVLPKHLEPRLVALRDPRVHRHGTETLAEIVSRVKDQNWRIFVEDDQIVALNATHWLTGTDPFLLFDGMEVDDPGHAFYLGYELAKARTALTLGKDYRQDQALDWGHLTVAEVSHKERTMRLRNREGGEA